MEAPFVSVVINFYNEMMNIDMAPFALSKQNYDNFEVIFVDDGSTDGTTQQILNKYEHKLQRIGIIRNDVPVGLRKARNQGVRSAKGSIIVTLDLHTTFDESFLERIVTAFSANNEVAAVGALVLPYGEKWFHDGFRTLNKLLFSVRNRFKNYDYVFGSAAAYKSDVLEKMGYLSEGDVVEDVDASWKITNKKHKVLTLSNNMVFHKGPQSFGKFLKACARDGLRVVTLLKKYKSKIFYPQILARILILPILGIITVIFPLLSLYAACGLIASLTIAGYVKSGNLNNALNFLFLTIIYTLATSFSIFLGFPLSILGKANVVKRIGLDW